jgi:hypothetical protein
MLTAELFTMIEIEAPAERVWAILTDFARYEEWNPLIRRIDGRIEVDQRLTVDVMPPSGKSLRFFPRLTEVRAPRELRWLGHRSFPGILQGDHRFVVEALDAYRCRLVHEERFSGLLVPLFKGRIQREVLPSFEAMNRALKRAAESSDEHQSDTRNQQTEHS